MSKQGSKGVREYKGDNQSFLEACKKADIPPTQRQLRKWERGIGKAFKAR